MPLLQGTSSPVTPFPRIFQDYPGHLELSWNVPSESDQLYNMDPRDMGKSWNIPILALARTRSMLYSQSPGLITYPRRAANIPVILEYPDPSPNPNKTYAVKSVTLTNYISQESRKYSSNPGISPA